MALTKKDLDNIKVVVKDAVAEGTEELAQMIQRDVVAQMATKQDLAKLEESQRLEFNKVHKRLDVLDVWQASFRDLVKILAEKNVLTSEEAARLGVQLDRRVA
jgi:hypothetical protein